MSYYEEFLSGHLLLPNILLSNFKEVFDSAEDFLVWLFLFRDKEAAPSQIAESTGKTLTEVNAMIQKMQKTHLLKVTLIEVDGQTDMIFDVAPTFQKIDALNQSVADQTEQVIENKLQSLAKAFEAEMGMISPIQLEELRLWLEDDKFEADLILAALREAALNRKLSLNYIRAILRRWRADGVNNIRDIEEQRELREISQNKGNSGPKTYSGETFSIPTEGF